MKAKAKHDISTSKNNRSIFIEKGRLLDVVLDEDRSDESGEIRLDGEYLCDNHSPFAKEHFYMLDELELVEFPEASVPQAPEDECDADKLYRLKNEGYTNLPYADVAWLVGQAEKAKAHEEWLNKIAKMNADEHSAADASYWALLALGKI